MTGSLALAHGLPHFSMAWGAWIATAGAAVLYGVATRPAAFRVTGRQVAAFAAAAVVVLVALGWPVAPLAAHRLLVALVVQRLVLLLAVPPLLYAAVPRPLVDAVTRPAALDALARTFSRPGPAVAFVTAVSVGTLTVPAVQAQATTAGARGGLDLALLVAGMVLWLPVLCPVPGTRRLSAPSRAAYLVVQSIVPSFLCIVWIFARHPLYPAYARPSGLFGLSPLVDQQLSGFVAKLTTIFVLWTVAGLGVLRAERTADAGGDPDPLTWADVARQLARVDRRERRGRLPERSTPGAQADDPFHLPPAIARRPPAGPRAPDAGAARPQPRSPGPPPGWALGSAAPAPRPDARPGRWRRHPHA